MSIAYKFILAPIVQLICYLTLVILFACSHASANALTYNNYDFIIISGSWKVKTLNHEEVIELVNLYNKENKNKKSLIFLNRKLPEKYWYRFKVRVTSGSHFHTLFNAKLKGDALDSFYQMSIRFSSHNVNLKKKESGHKKFTIIEGPKINVSKNRGKRWIDCMLVKHGSRILIYVSDMKVPKIDLKDPLIPLEGGRISLGFLHQYNMLIKDFEYHSEPFPLLGVHMGYPESTCIRMGEKIKVQFKLNNIAGSVKVRNRGWIRPYGDYTPIEYEWSDDLHLDAEGTFMWEYKPKKEGVYEATFFINTSETSTVKREYFAVVDTSHSIKKTEYKSIKLVASIPLKTDMNKDVFRHNEKGRFVHNKRYSYWESGPDKKDYLALRMRLKRKHLPHLVKIQYPDNSDRSMSFSLHFPGRRPEDIGGVHTGYDIAVTGELKDYSAVFWPKENDFMLMVMNWWKGHRAALNHVQIYELDDQRIPESAVKVPEPHRQFGLWSEDPNGIQIPLGIDSEQVKTEPPAVLWYRGVERLSKHMWNLGLNTVYYPVLWYGIGSTFPSKGIGRNPSLAGNKFYNDYIKLWCLFGEKYGYEFHAYIVGWGLPELIRKAIPAYPLYSRLGNVKRMMQSTLPEILAGKDTVALINNHNMVSNGGRGSIGLNPLHPEIRKAFDKWLDGFLVRYGQLPAFKGIDIQLSQMANLFCFPSEHSGYGDYTVTHFKKETGIKVPDAVSDPKRFEKRYKWLRKNDWQKWLDWRADHITKILHGITNKVKAFRKDLDIDFELYNFWLLKLRKIQKDDFYANLSRNNHTGIDLGKIFKINGARILRRVSPGYDRHQLAYRDNPSGFMKYRWAFEHPCQDKYAQGVFFYHKYYEYRHRGEKRDIFKSYKKAGPIANYLLYSGRNTIKPWMRQIASIDPVTLVFGGYGLLTAGREDFIKEFARNFTTLPSEKFVQKFNHIQPVTYRELKKGGRTYFYLVNDTYIPAQIRILLKNNTKVYSNNNSSFVYPQVDGTSYHFTIDMPGYNLRSFEGDAGLHITDIKLSISKGDIDALKTKVEDVERFVWSKDNTLKKLQRKISIAFEEKRYRDIVLLLEHPLVWSTLNNDSLTN